MINCCNGCVAPKRHIGCHATCEEYIFQKSEHEKGLEKIREFKKIESGFCEDRLRNAKRIKRYKHIP